MSDQLSGRRAVVTGAGGGIGGAIAQAYAREGARLLLADLNSANLARVAERCRDEGAEIDTITADVGDVAGADAVIARCVARFGGIDVLVNNAGLLTQAPCTDLTIEMFDEMLRVDLRSVFLCTRRALPPMIAQGWGRIINIASQLGIKGGAELSHYAAAKAGVIGFTKSVALEVATHNVLANCIAPGPINTAMVAGISTRWKEAKSAELPLRRFGESHEVAPTAVLLASDPGGNLYCGQTLGPNSGDVMQ